MYTLAGKKCGTVRFEPFDGGVVNKETVSRQSQITDNPIEGGGNISDHVFRQPKTIQLAGTVVNGAEAISQLDRMWRTGDVLTYTGRNLIDNLVIQNLQSTHDATNRKGFTFTATLKQITIGSSEYVAMGVTPLMSQQDTGSGSGGSGKTSQTAKTKADGLKTTTSTVISSNAYSKYVNTYNKKPASSSGPSSRATPSNTGRAKK